jgi:hypothetical protein
VYIVTLLEAHLRASENFPLSIRRNQGAFWNSYLKKVESFSKNFSEGSKSLANTEQRNY